MKIENIKHVFFDLDHTLWDFEKNSALTFKKIFETNKLSLPLNDFLKVYKPINFAYWKKYREEQVSKTELRYRRLKDAFTAINENVSDDLIHQLSHDYIEFLTTFNFTFHGTNEILNHLKESYELHIITNGFEEAQKRKLENSNLNSFFRTVTNSDMVGVKKPNPRIFNYALDLANALPEESIMIGDSLEADIYGAQNVGMDVIWFNPEKDDHSSDIKTVYELNQLKFYL